MSDLPNPQPLEELLTVDGVDQYKRFDCYLYTRCLTTASNAGWSQFHCNDCSVYVPIPDDDPSNDGFARLAQKLIDIKRKNGHNP